VSVLDALRLAWGWSISRDGDVGLAAAAEVRAEVEHHLACAEAELLEQGRTPEEARREARARFGDVDEIERQCRRIRMGNTIVLQRLHRGLTAVLFLVVVFLIVTNLVARRELLVAVDQMRAEAMMGLERAHEARQEAQQAEALRLQLLERALIGVGDTVEVRGGGDELFRGTVAEDGTIPVPGDAQGAAPVHVAGRTRADAGRLVGEACGRSVEVTIASPR